MPNKMLMFLNLQHWIDLKTDFDIVDCTHQRPEYAPYVVTELLKATPPKKVPQAVLEALKAELVELNQPIPQKLSSIQKLVLKWFF